METALLQLVAVIIGGVLGIAGSLFAMRLEIKAERQRWQFAFTAEDWRQYRTLRAQVIEALLLPRRDAHIRLLEAIHRLRSLLLKNQTKGEEFEAERQAFFHIHAVGSTWLRIPALDKLNQFSHHLEVLDLDVHGWQRLLIETLQRVEWSLGIEELESHLNDLETQATQQKIFQAKSIVN